MILGALSIIVRHKKLEELSKNNVALMKLGRRRRRRRGRILDSGPRSFPAENGRGKNTVNSCHCVLSATPKGSVCSMLKPKVDECNLI